jgi:transglutaminase-like putative cysteine protease
MATLEPVGFREKTIRRFLEASLLAMLMSGYGAMLSSEGLQSGALDVAATALAGVALLARLWMVAVDAIVEIPPRYVDWLTLLYMGFYPLDYLYVSRDFLRATLHLVFFVAIIKVLTASRPRDYFLLKIIAFLEILAASILSVNLSFLIFLVLFLSATVATLASTEILRASARRQLVTRGAGVFGRRLGRLTAMTTLAILVVTSALFFVLPRTARAALERLLPPAQRVSGFASEVTLGQVGELRRQGTAVMHVRFESGFQPVNLRWRGVALAEFNGLKWYNSSRQGKLLQPDKGWLALVDDDERRRPGRRISYQAFLHNTGTDWLFLAGRVEQLHVADGLVVVETPAGGYRVPFAEPDGLRYDVSATLGEPGANRARIREQDRNFHLRLPPLDPRVMALAQRITAGARTDFDRARAIERYLRNDFRYSLEALDQEVEDPLAHFLFVSKKGHCEYFASSMGVLLRAVWVPSRVATGFQSGSFNPISGWHVVRASDAHSWVEAWVPGEGWLTFDPTPSAPAGGATALSRLALWADAASVFWQEWVLGYDLDRQLTLAFEVDQKRRGVSTGWSERFSQPLRKLWNGAWRAPDWQWRPWQFALPLALLLLILGPWLRARMLAWLRLRRLRQGQPAPDDASLIYRQMLMELRRRGLVKPGSSTPAEFARELQPTETAVAVGEFTELYYALRFGGRNQNAARLAALLDRIEKLP